jgi:hypothetical protein
VKIVTTATPTVPVRVVVVVIRVVHNLPSKRLGIPISQPLVGHITVNLTTQQAHITVLRPCAHRSPCYCSSKGSSLILALLSALLLLLLLLLADARAQGLQLGAQASCAACCCCGGGGCGAPGQVVAEAC